MQQLLFILLTIMSASLSAQTDYRPIFRELGAIRQLGDAEEAVKRYADVFERVDYLPAMYLRRMAKQAKRVGRKAYTRRYEAVADQLRKPKDTAYAAELLAMLKEDQRVRSNKYMRAARLVYDRPVGTTAKYRKAKALRDEWIAVDSANIQRLLTLVEERGFPGDRLVGTYAYHSAIVMFIHYDRDADNIVLQPIFDQALQRGDIMPYDYAYVLDRHVGIHNTAPQTYCSFPNSRTETEATLEACNLRRAELGLPPRMLLRDGKSLKVKFK